MRILQVIHGYPLRYNAGSEVYTQTLCQGLAGRHEVHVFTREEDSFAPDFALRREPDEADPRVILHLVNIPRSRDRYRHAGVDRRFAELLAELRPEIVHVGHLNRLSTSLLVPAARAEVPVVMTLHDYWLLCPRGQLMQMEPENPLDLWAACAGQEDRRCAERCYARYFSGADAERAEDLGYWEGWVQRRQRHVRAMTELVDVFVAPSRYLLERMRQGLRLPPGKLRYLDYGFDRLRLAGRCRRAGEPFTFGYIGTHIPAKGIHLLIAAFGRVRGSARLSIYGRPRGQDSEALKALASRLPGDAAARVRWLPEYRNQEIVREVFDEVDAIVVPSIWVENSPLVIHEAQQARVPVITADAGGMAEFVRHEENGLLFRHRDPGSLAAAMQRLADDPALAARLGTRGYLRSPDGEVPAIDDHVAAIQEIYARVLRRRDAARIQPRPGPWRLTLDTNPDTCSLHCVMCEQHAEQSPARAARRAERTAPRLMPVALARRAIEEAVRLGVFEIIPSTMGEPLLYPGFEAILELIRQHGLRLNLTTNGTFPGLGARAWAELIVPLACDVKISWNGATGETQEQIMVGSRFAEHVANARAFIEVRDAVAAAGGNRCQMTMQITFMEANLAEIPELVRLAVDLGFDRVKGHHVWTHFPELEAESLTRSADAVQRWNQAARVAHRVAGEHLLPGGRAIRLQNFDLIAENAQDPPLPEGPCPFLGQEAWVSAEGRFDPCCAPDELRRRLGDFGNLAETSLGAIWSGEAYQLLVRSYRSRDLCLGCRMRAWKGEDA